MIRIDTLAPDGSARPAGAFSVFALHGTGNASENDLLDGDIHALVERSLERAIDSMNGSSPGFRSRAVHLFANGTEGDVSPDWPANARCNPPTLRPAPRSGGPRSPQRWDWGHPPSAHVGACLAAARTYVNLVGDALGNSARSIFSDLEGKGSDTIRIARAFTTLHLERDADSLGICGKPAIGTSTAAGADDGITRFAGWRLLGLFEIGLEEGGRAVDPNPNGCHREKNVMLASLLGSHDLPEVAQIMVVRIGGLLLGVLPAEVTTEAGAQMRRVIAHAAGWNVMNVALLGLANGFIQYVATDQEYSAQSYEGGSTLYGPRSAAMFASALGALTARLKANSWSSPPARVDPVMMYPGESAKIFPRAPKGKLPHLSSRKPKASCTGDTLVVAWRDLRPGGFQVADGPLLEIQDSTPGWTHVAWDDDRYVEVRALREDGDHADWELRWAVPRPGTFRVMLLPRADGTAPDSSNTRFCGRQ
jgi:hypothetical protein